MGTFLDHCNAGRSDPETVGDTLTTTLMHARNTLPRGLNGKPILLADTYAAKVVAEMSAGRSQEFKRIYAVCQCLLLDHGVSLPLVTAALSQAITMLEVEATTHRIQRHVSAHRELPQLLRAETRAQGVLDIAQLRVLEAPECPDTLSDAVHAGEKYLAAYQPWSKAVVALWHRVKHTPAMQPSGPRLSR